MGEITLIVQGGLGIPVILSISVTDTDYNSDFQGLGSKCTSRQMAVCLPLESISFAELLFHPFQFFYFTLAGFFGPIVTATKGRYKMQIGPIKFQAGQGDITKEDTDVIVNISNKSFSLKAGTPISDEF